MDILSDLHHGDLFESFRILFENRIGARLFHPIGLDWAEKGYWTYADNHPMPETRDMIRSQYLDFKASDGLSPDGTYYVRQNACHGNIYKMLSLDKFFKTPIDIVICSVANHEAPFWKLCQEHPNHPKLIRQTGNISESINYEIIKNLMIATIPEVPVPEKVNSVVYHPEFSEDVFRFELPTPIAKKRITNLMNCLPNYIPPLPEYFKLYESYKKELVEFDWKMHGILGEDGNLDTTRDIAEAIRKSSFIWHTKFGGDGYGFSIHYAFSCGRPVITIGRDYKNKMAGKLLEDKVTCIDLEKRKPGENIRLIRELSAPDKLNKICKEARQRFDEVVDFNKEFKNIKEFLGRLQ